MEPVVIRARRESRLDDMPTDEKSIKRMFTVELSARLSFQGLLFQSDFHYHHTRRVEIWGKKKFNDRFTNHRWSDVAGRPEPVFQNFDSNFLHTDRMFKLKRKISRGKLVSHGLNCASNEGCIVDTWYSHDGWHFSRLFTSGVVTSHFSRFVSSNFSRADT